MSYKESNLHNVNLLLRRRYSMVNSFQVYQLPNSRSVAFIISLNCECTFLFIYTPNYQILIKNNYIFMTQILLLFSLYIELRPLLCIQYNILCILK